MSKTQRQLKLGAFIMATGHAPPMPADTELNRSRLKPRARPANSFALSSDAQCAAI